MSRKVLTQLDMGSSRILTVGTPTATQDAVTKTYADATVAGLTVTGTPQVGYHLVAQSATVLEWWPTWLIPLHDPGAASTPPGMNDVLLTNADGVTILVEDVEQGGA